MDQLLVAPGGAEKGGLSPFDLIRAVNGQLVTRATSYKPRFAGILPAPASTIW